MRFIATVWKLIEAQQRMIIGIAAAACGYETIKLAIPYLTKVFIDTHVASGGQAISALHGIILGTMATLFVISQLDLVIERLMLRFLFDRDGATHVQGTRHALMLPMTYHEREQAGTTVSRIDRGCEKLIMLLHDVTWQTLPTLCSVVLSVGAMCWVDWRIAAIFAASIPPIFWLAYRQQRTVYAWRSERYGLYERSWAIFTEAIWNMRIVQSFAREDTVLTRYRDIQERIVALSRKQIREETRYALARSFIGTIVGQTLVLAVATWRAYGGALTIGDVVLLVTYAQLAYKSLFNGIHLFGRVADAYEGIARYAEFLATAPDITDATDAARASLTGTVTFDHVGFAYPDALHHALHDLSFAITPGETVAFVGPSGAGKSTIVQLILRHHDVTDGSVLMDGHNLRALDRKHVRSQIGYVPQEGQVFSMTVAENIRFGKPDATDAEVREAALLAGAHEFILQLTKQYETEVGEQGVHLSGGQRQRMCIARAIVGKPKILIFDEATSALDVENERVVQESLVRLKGTTTIIIIAHRLSTIRHADRIFVIQDGTLAEVGSHAQLQRKNGLYHRLVALQHTGA
ncbi:MAG: ABC transporter ATP-binding protein [bacterium]|nr:ABC transporter ATP-binding protein [bacterium]